MENNNNKVENSKDSNAIDVDKEQEEIYEIERIVKIITTRDGSKLYKVKWKGYSLDECTLEPYKNLGTDGKAMVKAYYARNRVDEDKKKRKSNINSTTTNNNNNNNNKDNNDNNNNNDNVEKKNDVKKKKRKRELVTEDVLDDAELMKRAKYEKNNDINAILLDIEGTTTPIKFVTDILFPFARDNVRRHLDKFWDEDECKADVNALVDEMEKEEGVKCIFERNDRMLIDTLVEYVHKQIKENRKTKPFKQLQGHIWKSGYENKELVGVMFPDVKPCLESWHRRGYKIYIYSSGSIEAQKLIFKYSDVGDLSVYLSNYFDLTTGQKTRKESYDIIADTILENPQKICFITDRYQEAIAARDADFQVLISVREGNFVLPEGAFKEFKCIESFVDAQL